MKIPNKKIFAYIKKYNQLDFYDIRNNPAFNKFKVNNITSSVLQKVDPICSLITFDGYDFSYFRKIEKNNENIYYGVFSGDLKRNPKLFYTHFRDRINENGYTYLLYDDRFIVEFKKKVFPNDA